MTDSLQVAANVQGTSARTINLCIGGGALLLGPGLVLVGLASKFFLPSHPGWNTAPSISEYYYFNDLTRNGFVGVLCAMGLLMSAYRGWSRHNLWDRVIAIISWIAAWSVALIPCYSKLSHAHFAAAATLFGLMAVMLWFRFTDNTGDADEQRFPVWKNLRNRVYRICACVIIGALSVQALSMIKALGMNTETSGNLTFWIEVAGLSAFSIGWLTKSRYMLGYKSADGWLHRTPAREAKWGKLGVYA